ncbi:MAG: universal stress protein [Dermatophilaceae bacterium]
MSTALQSADRVVVGSDGSRPASAAVEWAAAWAWGTGKGLTLVGTVRPFPSRVARRDSATYDDGLRKVAQEHLDTERERLLDKHPELDVVAVAITGTASHTLVEASKDASLVVVGTRGVGAMAGMLLGSTSDDVVTYATGPVAIVPDEAKPPHLSDIAVGVDIGDDSMRALSFAIDSARSLGVPVRAVHAVDVAAYMRMTSILALTLTEEELLEEGRQDIDEALSKLGGTDGVTIEPVVSSDRPIDALTAATETSSLVVVGSRGRGGFAGLLLGSTSRKLAQLSKVPTIVVRGR